MSTSLKAKAPLPLSGLATPGTEGDSMLNGASAKAASKGDGGSDLLTVRQVAGSLNIHPNTVRRWAANRLLRTFRVGPRGDRRFRRADVERLLQNQEQLLHVEADGNRRKLSAYLRGLAPVNVTQKA